MSDAGSQASNQTYEVDTRLTDATSRYTANCSNSSHSNGGSNCTDASHVAGQPSTENGNQAFQFWLRERLVLVSAAVSAKCKQRPIAGQTNWCLVTLTGSGSGHHERNGTGYWRLPGNKGADQWPIHMPVEPRETSMQPPSWEADLLPIAEVITKQTTIKVNYKPSKQSQNCFRKFLKEQQTAGRASRISADKKKWKVRHRCKFSCDWIKNRIQSRSEPDSSLWCITVKRRRQDRKQT